MVDVASVRDFGLFLSPILPDSITTGQAEVLTVFPYYEAQIWILNRTFIVLISFVGVVIVFMDKTVGTCVNISTFVDGNGLLGLFT